MFKFTLVLAILASSRAFASPISQPDNIARAVAEATRDTMEAKMHAIEDVGHMNLKRDVSDTAEEDSADYYYGPGNSYGNYYNGGYYPTRPGVVGGVVNAAAGVANGAANAAGSLVNGAVNLGAGLVDTAANVINGVFGGL